MKYLISIFVGTLSSIALATPGDVGCTANSSQGEVDLLLGYDDYNQTGPSLVRVALDGDVAFLAFHVKKKAGTVNETTWLAEDQGNVAEIRIPDQEESQDTFTVFLSVSKDWFKFENLEMTCVR